MFGVSAGRYRPERFPYGTAEAAQRSARRTFSLHGYAHVWRDDGTEIRSPGVARYVKLGEYSRDALGRVWFDLTSAGARHL